jgi:hypothetical protein
LSAASVVLNVEEEEKTTPATSLSAVEPVIFNRRCGARNQIIGDGPNFMAKLCDHLPRRHPQETR